MNKVWNIISQQILLTNLNFSIIRHNLINSGFTCREMFKAGANEKSKNDIMLQFMATPARERHNEIRILGQHLIRAYGSTILGFEKVKEVHKQFFDRVLRCI